VLGSPSLFTVTFANDPFDSALADFGASILASPWWSRTTAEYCSPGPADCIGPGKALGHAALAMPTPPVLSDDDLHTLIQSHIMDGTFPTPSGDAIYALYLPPGVTVNSAAVGTSCQDFHAYHYFTDVMLADGGTARVTYLVIMRCPDGKTLDAMTLLGSHELVEAATDPFLDGFVMNDVAWAATHGGESCDLCLYSGGTHSGGWAVERGFSNTAASRGFVPCVPTESETNFNAAPADGDTVLTLAVGETATLDLVGFAMAPTPDWTLKAVDSGGGDLALTVDRPTLNNGLQARLTVTLLRAPSSGKAPFMIRSVYGAALHFWPGVVLAK
jgi:hypothetical protein